MSAAQVDRAAVERWTWDAHLPLVHHLAARMIHRMHPYVELDDLVAIGVEALLRSAERYDPARGVSFGSFAYLRVRGAMCESMGAVGPATRGAMRRRPGRPQRAFSAHRNDERYAVGGCARREVTRALEAACLRPRLGRALASLDEADRMVIVRHYFDGETLAAIGRDLGKSRVWACRAHLRALASLRAALDPAVEASIASR